MIYNLLMIIFFVYLLDLSCVQDYIRIKVTALSLPLTELINSFCVLLINHSYSEWQILGGTMRNLTSILLLTILLVVSFSNVSIAQFEEVRRVNLGEFGINSLYGIATNPDDELIYCMILRQNTVVVFDQNFEEEIERIQLQGPEDIYGIDYNPEDNTWWCADRRNNNIYHFDTEGEQLDSFHPGDASNGVTFCSENGHLYVSEHPGGIREVTIDGEQVAQYQQNTSLTAIDYYPPNNSLIAMHGNDQVFEYSLDGEQLAVIFGNDIIESNGLGLDYDPQNRLLYCTGSGGIVHIFEDNHSAVPSIVFEPEAFNVNLGLGLDGEEELTIGNAGEEESILRFRLEIDEGEVDWLTINDEPEQIAEGEEQIITLFIATAELEPGQFERIITIATNDPENRMIEIPVNLTVISGFGEFRGTVIDASNDQPIEGAQVSIPRFDFVRETNEDGIFVFEEIPEWVYAVYVSADDYLPQQAEDVQIIEDEVTVLEFELLHSICDLSIDNITEELDVDEELEVGFTVSNPGNGTLTWTADLVFPEGMEADSWELRDDVPAGVVTEDSRIQGAVFTNDHFYLSGSNNRDPVMYVLNRDLELVDQYGQLGEGRYGYKDLAFDGELIWGSGERAIYGFTPDGEEVTSFDSGISPCNNLAWDSDRDILFASGTTSDIAGFDSDGNQVAEIERGDLRVYGLAYWPDDPDGYQLYIFHKINDVGDLMIAKIDIENNDVMDVVSLEHEVGGAAQGCFITNQWDYYSWVFMGVANSGAEDRVDIWHLEANTGWVGVEPVEGILESGEDIELTTNLNTFGFPVNLEFTVDLVFSHDGVGGETVLAVSLTAGGEGGGGPEERTVALDFGWNMISVNVEPDDNDVIALTQALVDEDLMEMMKNGAGQFYSAAFGFNNIPGWEVDEGYMIKTTAECELTIEGMPIAADAPIPLANGWQMIAYFPRVPVDAVVALSGIVDNLEIAKDGAGRFYSTAFGFSNMGNLTEGGGYMLKMTEAMDLIYVVEENQVAQSNTSPEILPVVKPTAENMSLLVLSGTSPEIDDLEIGVYSSEILVGSGRLINGECGIAVWGDDPTTESRDGAFTGEYLELRCLKASGEHLTYDFATISGGGVYKRDELWVVELSSDFSIPEKFGIVSAYPNPFNSATQISFGLTEPGTVNFALFDLNGRRVTDLVNAQFDVGLHTVMLNGSQLSSGLYIAKLTSIEGSSKLKLSFIK